MGIWDDHYDLLYDLDIGHGRAATLKLAGFSDPIEVTAIPKIAGASIDAPGVPVEVATIKPAVDVRVSELTDNGIVRADLKGGTIDVAGKTWRIDATVPRPSPEGEANGEIRLVLIEL